MKKHENIKAIQQVKVISVRYVSSSTFVLKTERNNFKFIPGQCVNIGLVGKAVNREYSTYSSIHDTYLEFLIKKIVGGTVSGNLSRVKPGKHVTLDGPYGKFIIENPKKKQKYVCIGSGTGIAPFHSFVKSYPDIDYQILHGIRFASEQYDRQDYKQGRYIACVSRGKGGNFSGRVTEYIKKMPLDQNARYYLCGNEAMINDVYDIMTERGINGSNIVTEVFF